MGIFRTNKIVLGALSACALVGAALAQQTTAPPAQSTQPLKRDVLDLGALRTAPPQTTTIDFENVQGPQSGAGIELSKQYEQSHGVSFGRGASVHFCARVFDDVASVSQSLCPYPRAASGRRAGVHGVRAGGPAMVMDFSRLVSSVSMRINPTGGTLDEAFLVQLEGFDANGVRVVTDRVQFNWSQDAFSWPTVAGLETNAAPLSRVNVTLRRVAQNNQPVRFLIDDLTLQYAPENTLSPVAEAIAEQRGPQRPIGAVIVQSTQVSDAQSQLRLYSAATRKRVSVDWDAVDAALARQKDLGLAAASYRGQKFVNAAELPLLLPSKADAGSIVIVGNRDSYNATFKTGGLAYSLYGSRLLTVIDKNSGAPANNEAITFAGTEEALTASFSVYGVSYSLTRHCKDESVTADPACHDRDALGNVAAQMVVIVGEAGERRP